MIIMTRVDKIYFKYFTRGRNAMKLSTVFMGLVLIAIGVLLWLSKLNIIAIKVIWIRDWPMIIIVVGLMELIDALTGRPKRRTRTKRAAEGLFIALIGVWLWLWKLGVPKVSFGDNWPLLLVIAGIYMIFHKARKDKRIEKKEFTVMKDSEES